MAKGGRRPSWEDLLREIEGDRQHGASYLTAQALRAVATAAQGLPDQGWADGLRAFGRRLARARPSMVGLGRAAVELADGLASLGPAEGRRRADALAQEALRRLEEADARAVGKAAALLSAAGPDVTVVTCSYSSTVLAVFRAARDGGLRPRVLALASGRGPDAHGRRLATALAELGLEVAVVDDEAVAEAARRAHVGLVGADAVTPRFLVNGWPTLSLARHLRGRAPLLAVCQWAKVAAEVQAEAGFDLVPLELVTRVVTDRGALTPRHIRALAPRLWAPPRV